MDKIIMVEKSDVLKSIYFIAEMVQNVGDKGMYGGLSGKSDLMGGIFDRWINQIPESVIFNKLILAKINEGKNIEIITDFYKYSPKQETTGIAPDVIGLRVDDKIVPFIVYDKKWTPVKGMPQIEVKTFKKPQKMVSLRDQGYDGQYLVMVESDFRVDYLLPFFEKAYFSDEVYEKMTMNDSIFIINNDGQIEHLKKVINEREDLGTLRLLSVTITEIFKDYSNYCEAGVSPVRINGISEPKYRVRGDDINEPITDYCFLVKSDSIFRFNDKWSNDSKKKYLDFQCSDINAILIIRKNKGCMYISLKNDCALNHQELKANHIYKIEFMDLNREGSKDGEYFLQKDLVVDVPSKLVELEEELSLIIKNAKNM